MIKFSASALTLALLVACSAGPAKGTGSSETGASSGSGSSGTGSGTGSGSATSGGATGSTGNADSLCMGLSHPLTDCDAGQVELLGSVMVASQSGASPQKVYTLTDLADGGPTGTVGSDGLFYFCAAPGTLVTPEVASAMNDTTIFASFDLQQSTCLQSVVVLPSYFSFVLSNLQPPFDATKGTLLVTVQSEATGACPLDGWSFTLQTPDGGSLIPPAAFLKGTTPDQMTTQTYASGTALLYNLDPAWSHVSVVGSHDGGLTGCQDQTSASPLELNGQVSIKGNEISETLYILP